MVLVPKKAQGLKIGRALKTAAMYPVRVSGGRGTGRNKLSPLAGEQPIVLCRVQVIRGTGLLAKDKNGNSDPFVVVTLLNNRHQTPVIKKSLNPVWSAKDATFDFPIYLSLADRVGTIEFVCWDKDVLKKEYLGEVALTLEDWFKDGNALGFDDPCNRSFTVNLVSTRASIHASGTIEVKLGFITPPNTTNLMEYEEVFDELVKRSRPSLVSMPPTEGMGTVRSHHGGPAFEDDGGISSEDEEFNPENFDDDLTTLPPGALDTPLAVTTAAVTPLEVGVGDDTLPAAVAVNVETATPQASKPPSPGIRSPKIFMPRPILAAAKSYDQTGRAPSPSPTPPVPGAYPHTAPSSPSPRPGAMKKQRFRKSWVKKREDFNLSSANDILGIVLLDIQSATDLPRLKNMTRTGFDMDPFVVISFGKKVFRTRIIRHSLNPRWDEKLLFHVRRYETAFNVQLSVLDWDKLSSNDHVGDTFFNVAELLRDAPQPDPNTGLYAAEEEGNHPMKEFQMPLVTMKEMPWEAKHRPVLTFRAKYQPYDALRQQFWRQYLKQYDTDDSGRISHIELTSMLDSLGSTLTNETIVSFWTWNGKTLPEDELTLNEAVQCLETEIGKPVNERKRIDSDEKLLDSSAVATPLRTAEPEDLLALDKMDFSGPPAAGDDSDFPTESRKASVPAPYPTEPNQLPLTDVVVPKRSSSVPPSTSSSRSSPSRQFSSQSATDVEDNAASSEDSFERVINVKNCPLCHRPRLNSKAEIDIVTHLAVCASQDWGKVNRIMVGNFVTASQAQRKWYTKVISKISSGNYRLGANSANIIVQNRITGQLEEEKMQVYVRLGIRLLYKGWKSRMEGARARRLLKSMSVKQGIKYDSPESARDIVPFIQFHRLNPKEFLEPVSSYKTFNQFFYRKLHPDARPCESPEDEGRLVSAADCRFMAFETVSEATRLWIKGRDFTVARLLGDALKREAERYSSGGALAIFRLAPQDYHRFHCPVDGTIGPIFDIPGEYYTVNPQAIRTTIDVYGENVRKVVPIDSPKFGRVMVICIGAMMVGSILLSVKEGQQVRRTDELGYFAFGGSTLVVLFEKGVVEWDEDLLINGRASLETLVRVGMGIGRRRRSTATA